MTIDVFSLNYVKKLFTILKEELTLKNEYGIIYCNFSSNHIYHNFRKPSLNLLLSIMYL